MKWLVIWLLNCQINIHSSAHNTYSNTLPDHRLKLSKYSAKAVLDQTTKLNDSQHFWLYNNLVESWCQCVPSNDVSMMITYRTCACFTSISERYYFSFVSTITGRHYKKKMTYMYMVITNTYSITINTSGK